MESMPIARNHDLHGAAPDDAPLALLILDMISDFSFDRGAALARAAVPVARRIARLRARADDAGVPVIYVNDSRGRWRSDFTAVVGAALHEGSRGAAIAQLLAPRAGDYCILKPKHSGFYATPLATLLEHLGSRRLILTGAASHQCVLFTANDAYIRDLGLSIPRDCVAAESAASSRLAFEYFRRVLGADLRPSGRLRLAAARRRSRPRRSG
jgi:nicotinamidase-related amidase